MKLLWKRIWKALGDLALVHWIFTFLVPQGGLAIYAWVAKLGPEKIIYLSPFALAFSVLILVLLVSKRLKEVPAAPPRRIGISAKGSRVTVDGGTIKNQTVGIDATDSEIKGRNLDIE